MRTGAEHLADDLLRQLTCVVENVQEHLLNESVIIAKLIICVCASETDHVCVFICETICCLCCLDAQNTVY